MTYIGRYKADLRVVGTRPVRPDGVDKVTGRAAFGADMVMPGMIWGKVKRSPHAHARDQVDRHAREGVEALPGVKAVMTAADLPDIASEEAFVGEGPMNFRDLSRNCMARGKVLYEGHAVAAVAATTEADRAGTPLDLIEVEYEVLPHVIDVEDAMQPDAPLLHEDMFTQGVNPKSDQAIERRQAHPLSKLGDPEAGVQGRRGGRRTSLHHPAGAPGVYRAACLRG